MPTEGWRKNDESQRKADGEKTRVIIGIIIIIIIVYDFLFLCSQIESFFKSCLFICLFVLFRVITFSYLSYRLFRFEVIKVHSCSGSPVIPTYLREYVITALSFCSSRSWEIYCVIWHLSIHWKSGTRSVCHRLTFLSDHTDLETALLIENADGYLVTFDMIWGHWYDSMVITLSRRRAPLPKISASTSRTFEDGHYRFVKLTTKHSAIEFFNPLPKS